MASMNGRTTMDSFFAVRSHDNTLGLVYAGRRGWGTSDRAATTFPTRERAEAALAQWRKMAGMASEKEAALYESAEVVQLQ